LAIVINLDVLLAERKMRLNEHAKASGITPQNLFILKTGKARAIRLDTWSNLPGSRLSAG